MPILTIYRFHFHSPIEGNLHLNISTPKADREVEELIEPFVYEWTGTHLLSLYCIYRFFFFVFLALVYHVV